jgi:coenzyme PQQ biosynthesis protein PqqD
MDFFARRAEVEAHMLPDQSLLLYAKSSGITLPVNESAAKIWELCDGTHSVDEIVEDLALRYDAPRSQIDQDAREFLAVLLGHGLLDQVSSPS